jgi:hypothetical protein|tara:strand:- start:322 stop:609 length:288 start_codon:yes stop_codon:yes gene_type:complete
MLHRDTVEEHTLELLGELLSVKELDSFVLVGGAALSLQIGHRISIDLNFISLEKFDEIRLVEKLTEIYPDLIITSTSKNSLALVIKGIKVDFHHR